MTATIDSAARGVAGDAPGRLGILYRWSATLRGRRGQLLSLVVAVAALGISVVTGTASSLALFTDNADSSAALGTKAIFPGERVTPAFSVADSSAGGSAVDRSNELAYGGDGRTLVSSAWSSGFSASHYLDFDLNASLPGGLAVSSADFEFRFASAGAGATTCYYLEVRRASTGALLDTYGSGGSPLACVTGTTPTLHTTSIAASMVSTDGLDDVRVRVLAADSGTNGMIIDQVTVSGATALAAFTLYPVRYTDVADGTPTTTVWELAGP